MKKKNPVDVMKDPFYADIMHRIETLIHERDEEAQRESLLELTDSNVKSAIRKALGFLTNKPPKMNPDVPREQWIGRIAIDLAGLSESLKSSQDLERKKYIQALLAVEDSLKTQREMAGHSRGYLDFLKRFIEKKRI